MTLQVQPLLRRIDASELRRSCRLPVDPETHDAARLIVDRVMAEGTSALREYAERFGERTTNDPIVLCQSEMRAALEGLDSEDRELLIRTAERINNFAAAQRETLRSLEIGIPGGRAGHTIEPVRAAGCYAPAGRYPLPSSVLMTAITARAAGVERVVVASPGANALSLAAAAVAGADEFLAVGGAHGIAAMAYGCDEMEPCDVIVGPGNKWVAAAKQIVSGTVGIDMLAGPSELLIIADETADSDLVAADLLAQAEHDTDAVPMLVTTSRSLPTAVDVALRSHLVSLPTRDTAQEALKNGFVCEVDSLEQACGAADVIAAEHLELMTADPQRLASNIRNAGAVFIGASTAEVLGDYGAGPNHTLPTGGTARFQGGLSVMHFVRLRTWILIDEPNHAKPLFSDAARLGMLEGLDAHVASAQARYELRAADSLRSGSG